MFDGCFLKKSSLLESCPNDSILFSPGWVGAVHSWASSPSSALAHGAGEPSAAARESRRACSSRVWRPGLRQANRPWEVAERLGSNPALAALGPEDAGAKAGLQAALERAKQKAKVAPSRAPAPEVTIDAARARVARLEAALSALADHTGPEVDALTAALARARIAASPPPVDVQVTQCQQFIERAVKRIDDLDKAREVEAVRLQEARDRLQRLQQEAAAATATVPPAGVPDAAAEVVHLRGMVSQLQVQLAKGEGGFAGPAMDVVTQELPTKKRPRPECFVSHTVEELIEWMDGRQSDMRVAVEAGNAPEVSRLAVLLAEGSAQLKSWTLNPSMASNTVRGQRDSPCKSDSTPRSRPTVVP